MFLVICKRSSNGPFVTSQYSLRGVERQQRLMNHSSHVHLQVSWTLRQHRHVWYPLCVRIVQHLSYPSLADSFPLAEAKLLGRPGSNLSISQTSQAAPLRRVTASCTWS